MGKPSAGIAYKRKGNAYVRGKGKAARLRLYFGGLCIFVGITIIILSLLTGKL